MGGKLKVNTLCFAGQKSLFWCSTNGICTSADEPQPPLHGPPIEVVHFPVPLL